MLKFKSMPFVDLTIPERERFLKEATGCHIPGYTGHCPTLKFRFGKRYGANTKEIIEELKDLSNVRFVKPYKGEEPWTKAFKETVREKGEEFDPIVYTGLPTRPFILGYTGFIPGLNFEYGVPFYTAASKSINKFTRKLREEERRREEYREFDIYRKEGNSPLQCQKCAALEPETKLADFSMKTPENLINRKEPLKHSPKLITVPPVAPELPPLTGYTGHIPGVKGTEASLSQRFHSAAKAGLTMLREQRKRHHHIDSAREAVAEALAYSNVP